MLGRSPKGPYGLRSAPVKKIRHRFPLVWAEAVSVASGKFAVALDSRRYSISESRKRKLFVGLLIAAALSVMLYPLWLAVGAR
jgi:hypothetical protein